ncbi:hypothetical protein REJ26_004245 [Providencia stuartii]|uniref:hypothetical protein n=1 Tax=Providencia sp. 2023EL-00965 TaxID=3084975 RepID=UPI0027F80213|nr:hypothetical protein [Providencia sp. 2023EL-00965]ELR5302394.1 hypothetical protein [Providencia stuartii]MDW7590855.1 hypothetical protein [Providencia sp. 2023EL-00965]
MNNQIIFKASIANCYTENDVVIIGIGDDPITPKNYLIISRFDDGDIDDSIGIQTHLSEREYSNIIDKVILGRGTLKVKIKPNKIKDIGFSSISVFLYNDKIDHITFKEYINNIFHKSSVKVKFED